MSIKGWLLIGLYSFVFVTTGVLSLAIGNVPESELAKNFVAFHNVIYAWHLGCWMVLGMIANYLWDHCQAKKGLEDISLPAILLPLLVSPIVFFAIWSLVEKNDNGLAEIGMVWPLIAFQNGFFWQVIFSKSAPK